MMICSTLNMNSRRNLHSTPWGSFKQNKKILLVNPWIYDFAAFDMWMKPMGLLYITSLLKSCGFDVSYIDCLDRSDPDLLEFQKRTEPRNKYYGCGNFHREVVAKPSPLREIPRNYCRYGIPPEIFMEKLRNAGEPDIVLVTSIMTYWYPGVKSAIEIIKNIYPDIRIVLGGIYATLCPEHALHCSGADVIYRGRGLKRLISIIEDDINPRSIEEGEDVFIGGFPYPDFTAYLVSGYFCLMTSQGCPFSCTYCASGLLSGKYIQREPDDVLNEIKCQIEITGAGNIAFYDDALLVDSENYFEKVLDGIMSNNINVNFHAPNGLHPKFVTYKLAEKMKRAGFKTVRLSLETSDVYRQAMTGGKVKNNEYSEAVMNLRKAGFTDRDLGTYIFFGFPGQPLSEVEDSIKFVKSAGSKVNLVEYSPIPGTVMWDELTGKGIIDNSMDPLLHNNSVFFRKYSGITENELYRLKLMAKS